MKKVEDIYFYDGSFDGLMTVIYYCLANKIIPLNILVRKELNLDLFSNYRDFETDASKASSLTKNIPKKISKVSLYITYNVYLSNNEKKEMVILYYLINGFKYGIKINNLVKLNCVIKAKKISKYVRNEAHKLSGFIRFKELDNGIFYSEIGPENNVLQIVSNHFKNRLSNENWIIRDVKHSLVSFYENNKITILKDIYFNFDLINKSNREKEIDGLWKKFFETIAIKERNNKRCQMNNMPKRYWQYMNEMEDKL